MEKNSTLNPSRNFSRGMELRAFLEYPTEEQRKSQDLSLQHTMGLQVEPKKKYESNFRD